MPLKYPKIRIESICGPALCTLFAVLWIIVSNQVLIPALPGTVRPNGFPFVEGIAFVAVTGVVLCLVVRKRDKSVERSRESLRKATRALKTLSACNQTLVRATDELALMKEVCRIIIEVGGYRLAWAGYAEDDEERTVRPVAQWGYEVGFPEMLRLSWGDSERGRGPTGKAIRSGKPSIVQTFPGNPDVTPWLEMVSRRGYASCISLPLGKGDGERPFGVISIFAGEVDAFDGEEVDLLKDLAENLSYGVQALRIKAEKAREERERAILASAIEKSAVGIAVLDSNGGIRYVNPTMTKIAGLQGKDLTGLNLFTSGRTEWCRSIRRHLKGRPFKENWTRRLPVRDENGSTVLLEVRISPLVNRENAVTSYFFLTRDVTRELQLEAQLQEAQKMEALGTLAGGISHDFNNILGTILTCSEIAIDEVPLASPVHEDLEHILGAARRGRALIKQILTFSRRGERELRPVEIGSTVTECLKLLRASLPANIEIREDIADGATMVLADTTGIHQVLLNLCTNAVQALPPGGGLLEVSLAAADLDHSAAAQSADLSPGPYLKLTVKDTGTGMTHEVMKRIFEPFFTTKPRGQGTGLGLAVVHGIVKSHDGAITVSSDPARGSTFEVFLPRLEHPAAYEESAEAGPVGGGGARILLVDDEAGMVYAVEKTLRRLGYDVISTTESRDALEFFRASPNGFDLVFTDQSMPHMMGTELAGRIHEIRPDVPIVLCSGFHSDPGETSDLKVREVVSKPLDKAELAEIVRRNLKHLGSEG